MTEADPVDLVVVGAGPAGMAAAARASQGGLSVVVLDSQPEPGGQIWRGVRRNANSPIMKVLGPEYERGVERVEAFLASKLTYIPNAQVSRIEQGWTVEWVLGGVIYRTKTRYVLLALGAQERPVPLSGWTLPGVMTVGAAQILLKTAGMLPKGPVVVLGNGPLPLLYQQQMRAAGAMQVTYLDSTPKGFFGRAALRMFDAMSDPRQILKGVALLPYFSRVPVVGNITRAYADGKTKLESVRYRTAAGGSGRIEATTLLIHEGLIPNHHLAVSVGARLAWDDGQSAFRLQCDEWMGAARGGLYIAGDGVRIGGARNAEIQGHVAALGVLRAAGALAAEQADLEVAPLRRSLARQKAFRRFLDAVYPPHLALSEYDEATTICRCEELTAGELRDAVRRGACTGPNQLKAFTRAGMGPCQGRQCGYPVHELVKSVAGLTADQVGLYNPRPPFVPLTVAMLAAQTDESA